MSTREEVFAEAERMVLVVRATARLAGMAPGPIDASRVEEQTAEGPKSTTFAQPGTAMATIKTFATVLVGNSPPPPPPPIPAEVALRDARVARALELFAGDPDWSNLYKILDVIGEDIGGGHKAVERTGWLRQAR